jgi:large subunit ribosomal protein L5
MNLYKKHYDLTIKKDLISRFIYKNNFQIIKINKISLNIGIKNFSLKKDLPIILLLEFITSNSPVITKSKKNNVFLNIRKNFINGAKLNLKKNKAHTFLQKFGLYIFPNIKSDKIFILKKEKSFSISLKKFDIFQELTFFYNYFKYIKYIDINIKLFSFLKNELESLFFFNSFKFNFFYLNYCVFNNIKTI